LFNNSYGNITAEFIIQYPAPSAQTGDTQVAVMDFSAMNLYIAYSRNGTSAYLTNYMKVNMAELYSITP